MAKFICGMNQSLDGYINHDHPGFRPSLKLFNHFVEHVRSLTGIVYGRGMYEVMRYWDDDQPDWESHEHEFAAAWRSKPKWIMSRTLKSVGPNATLVADGVEAVMRKLRAELPGEIGVGGAGIAHSLGTMGLMDEYRLYLHPLVLGQGKPFFAGPLPPLRFVASEQITENIIRLTYAPA
jgi:dihydrofolate reductase